MPQAGQLHRAVGPQAERKPIVYENKGASLVDLGDGVACVEFHSALQPKMNPIDDQIIEVIAARASRSRERDFRGLVVHHQGEQLLRRRQPR